MRSDFLKLWIGQTISEFGSRITREGLPLIAVITLAAAPSELGVLAALEAVPVLLFALPIGVWVDRLPRRPLMIGADLARAALLLALPLAALGGWLSMPLLWLIAPLLSLLTLVFSVAYRAVLPAIVQRRDLIEANSKLATSSSLAEVAGPAIAGLLIQWISAPLAMLFDAASFLFSATTLTRLETREARAERTAAPNALREAREGLALIAHHAALRVLVIGMSLRAFFGSFFAALYSYYVINDLGLSPAHLGVLVSAGGVGALAGALLANRLSRRFGVGQLLTVTLLIGSVVGLLTPFAAFAPAPLAFALMLLPQLIGDAMDMVYEINERSLQQTLIPNDLLGRVNASASFLAQGVAPLGALVGGVLGSVFGAQITLGIAVSGGLLTALWMLASPVRSIQFDAAGD